MQHYIIKASGLLNSTNKDRIAAISSDLRYMEENIPGLSIVLRGGAAIDSISGIAPNDFDLFYSFADKDGEPTSNCICDSLRNQIIDLQDKLLVIAPAEMDLENSYEKEPRLSPVERTVGPFSYHTDYNSQFVIDSSGDIWTNVDALEFHKAGIMEIRYEGFLPWAYYPRQGDSQNYWAFQTNIMSRGIAHIVKRNLKPGKLFSMMLQNYKTILENALAQHDVAKFQKYARSKINTKANFEKFVSLHISPDDAEDFRRAYAQIVSALD